MIFCCFMQEQVTYCYNRACFECLLVEDISTTHSYQSCTLKHGAISLSVIGDFFFHHLTELLDPNLGPAMAIEAGHLYVFISWASSPVLVFAILCPVFLSVLGSGRQNKKHRIRLALFMNCVGRHKVDILEIVA